MRSISVSIMYVITFAVVVLLVTVPLLINAELNGNYARLASESNAVTLTPMVSTATYYVLLLIGLFLILVIAIAPLINFIRRRS